MLLAFVAAAVLTAAQPISTVSYDFNAKPPEGTVVSMQGGEGARGEAGNRVEGGRLVLLEPWWRSWYASALPAPADQPAKRLEVQWTLQMGRGSEGVGFVWLPAEKDPKAASDVPKWEEPSVEGAFSIGLDASDPPTQEPFRGSGNIHHRPEHEASIHWNGRELFKKQTKRDFRDGKPHRVRLTLDQVPGGSEVSMWIGREHVFDRFFVADMHPYAGRPVFGGRNGETSGEATVDDLQIRAIGASEPAADPTTVVLFDKTLNDKDHHRTDAIVELPEQIDPFARITLTLRLEPTPAGIDPWDRLAHLWMIDDRGEKWEIQRYITPYRKGWEWKVDVTDLGPLLRGRRKFQQECVTYGEGWLVSAKLDYWKGPRKRVPTKVVRLWSGAPEIGNPDKPTSTFYSPRTVGIDPGTVGAKVRTVVTGHGMSPNTDNAAEFMPISRTLKANGRATRNRLWKTDNYLNPCRPQGGTWKYDRAGWAPGDVVAPWEVEVDVRGQKQVKVEYQLDPYLNKDRGKTWAPFHQTESYLILYRNP